MHLHVLSADLCSERMKNKKHYNSFHPKLGFFLHLEEILELFDATPSFYDTKVSGVFCEPVRTTSGSLSSKKVKQLAPDLYEPLLKKPLTCFRCDKEMKNIPTLKEHLEEEWDKLASRATKATTGKRKLQDDKSDLAHQESTSHNEQGTAKKAKP